MAVTTRLGLNLLAEATEQKATVLNTDLNLVDAAIAGLSLTNAFTGLNSFSNTSTFTGATKFGGVLGGNAGSPLAFNSASVTFPSSADYTLTSTEAEANFITINTTNIAGPLNMIVPNKSGAFLLVTNNSGFTITTKTPSGTGIAIASNRRALLTIGGAGNVTRVTADSVTTP
jgi:hypothetical protein